MVRIISWTAPSWSYPGVHQDLPHRTVNAPTTWEIPRDVGALLRCSYYHHYLGNYKGFRNSVSRNQGQRPNMRTSTPITQEIPRSLGALCQEPEVKVTQSCLTLCDPMDYTIHGILQARILEWVAVASPGLSLGCCTEKHNQAREWEEEEFINCIK